MYAENGTGDVAMYLAKDPEGSGVTYSLVTAAITDPDNDPDTADGIEEADITDRVWIEISSTRGILRFKASPNYEDPKDGLNATTRECPDPEVPTDGICDNMYQVTVKAEVADDQNPRDAIYQEVTVRVINIHEKPVFPKTTDTLDIWENPDDPEKEPTSERGYLYLLNRGVGKPAANLPAEPNLDVGIPMVAVDDDNTFTIRDYTGTDYGRTGATNNRPTQLIDGLTYELSGADAGPFHIVPATGQILTGEKLDYETKKTYNVTVKATDPWGLSGSIPVTINVIDVDEAPVGGLLTLGGLASHDYAENNPDTSLGIYTVSGATAEVKWTLEGADASHFELDDQGNPQGGSRRLKFANSPNYEMPRGQAMSDTNTNAYMVTVKVTVGSEVKMEVKMVEVTVMVTNVEETGTVTLSSTGAKVGTPITATLVDDDIVVGAPDWQWSRVLPATGSSNPITGARNSSYTPVAADVGNHLMVTATYTDGEGAGKSASERIRTAVAAANRPPEFASSTATLSVAENMPSRTLVGSPITATDPNGNNLSYSDSGTDAASFTVDNQGQLRTTASFNYEAKSSYSVTITATDPEGATGSIVVSVNVTNVDEDGMVVLSPNRPSIGTPITASVTDPDGTPTGVTYQWSHSTAMGGPFTLYPAENTASITPVEADFGRYLRFMVSYSDGLSAKTLSVTTGTVTRAPAHSFPSATASRSVAENTAAGTNIGTPVVATDVNGDTLSYSLSGTDAASFDIGMSTGQLMTKAALDYEIKMSYMVTVTATHPDGASDSIDVTINVTDVDETVITPDPNAALIARYDAVANGGNGNGMIDKAEVIAAINDYLDAVADAPSKADVITLINLYLDG